MGGSTSSDVMLNDEFGVLGSEIFLLSIDSEGELLWHYHYSSTATSSDTSLTKI